LLELGHPELVNGPLHELGTGQDHLKEFENMDHMGGMVSQALRDASQGIDFTSHHQETVGGFHTIDHYFHDHPDLGYDLLHMPGHALDAMHLDHYNEFGTQAPSGGVHHSGLQE
jgi:hypothetical protein